MERLHDAFADIVAMKCINNSANINKETKDYATRLLWLDFLNGGNFLGIF